MIVTFYSYKGGVGRSMAMANVADLLARRGRKVLIIDFDLEAPGLEQYFQINQAAARRNVGLLDLLLAYKRAMSVESANVVADDFRHIERHIVPVYQTLSGGGCLDLLPAGQREGREQLERYAASLRTFDWQDFYFNWEGELFFEWLRTELVPERYDIVLVDSRTGVTEMGGVCTYQLADVIVMLCAANHQNRQGTKSVALDFESGPVQTARRDRPLQILVIPARVELRSQHLFERFIASFEQDFAGYLPSRLREKGLAFRELTIPYEPVYAFEERVLSDPTQGPVRREIAAAFERLADAVVLLTDGDRRTAAPAESTDGTDQTPGATQFDPVKRFAGYDVFLSYDRGDQEHVDGLTRSLRQAGLEVFADAREIAAGEDWRARTEQALFHSRACMLAYGQGAGTGAREQQLLAAVRAVSSVRDLKIVPVLLPGSDADRIRATVVPDLARLQWLDLRLGLEHRAARSEIERLAASLQHHEHGGSNATAEYSAPYVELNPFEERDAGLFFGRERARQEVADLVERLSFVAVAAPSGCGKTSFVTAGVVPELRRRAGAGGAPGWLFARCTPREGVESLTRAQQLLSDAMGAVLRHQLLFVDDVEELAVGDFTEEKRQFVDRLTTLLRDDRIKVIAAVREDCLGVLAARCPGLPLSGQRLYPLPALTSAEIRHLIEAPAQKVGLAFEPGLVDRIMADWGDDQRFLPFLQSVLRSLWNRRREGFLTNNAYQAIPDPVESMAEAAFGALPADQQQIAARVLPRLIRLCGDLHLGRSCARADLVVGGLDGVSLNATLETLIQKRLVYAFAAGGEPRVAPAFASPQWTRAEQWLSDDVQFLEWLERLDRYRRDWVGNGSDPGALLAGALLREARGWLARRSGDLNEHELEYIQRSTDAARTRQRHRIAAALVVLLLTGALGAKSLYDESQKAQAMARERQVDRLILAAGESADAGEIDAALSTYADVLKIAPNHPVARIRRGTLLDAQGKHEAAIQEFSALIDSEIGPDDTRWRSSAFNGRAVANLHAGRPREALQDIQNALELTPGDTVSLFNRAVVQEALDAPDAALRDYSEALRRGAEAQKSGDRVTPDFVEALFNRGRLYQKLRKDELATADFKSILSLDVDAKTKQAAASRLAALGSTVASPQTRTYRVELYYGDANDEKVFEFVTKSLSAERFAVERVPDVAQDPTTAVVRYFFKEDAAAAANVGRITENALAERGYNVGLRTVYVALDKGAGDRRGEIHVRVPSLKVSALPTDLYRKAH